VKHNRSDQYAPRCITCSEPDEGPDGNYEEDTAQEKGEHMHSLVLCLVTATSSREAFKKTFRMINPFLERNHYDEFHEGCEQHPYDGEYYDSVQFGCRWGEPSQLIDDGDLSALLDVEDFDEPADQKQAILPSEELTEEYEPSLLGELFFRDDGGDLEYADEPADPSQAIMPIAELTAEQLASVIPCGVVWVEKENHNEPHRYGQQCCAAARSKTPIPALGALMRAHPAVNYVVIMVCHW
jgi:hypothetical protein